MTYVMGKARVITLKPITVPRLELTAVVLSLNISLLLRQKLDYNDINDYFWTDSPVVLGYINNKAKKFHVFVANCIELFNKFEMKLIPLSGGTLKVLKTQLIVPHKV